MLQQRHQAGLPVNWLSIRKGEWPDSTRALPYRTGAKGFRFHFFPFAYSIVALLMLASADLTYLRP